MQASHTSKTVAATKPVATKKNPGRAKTPRLTIVPEPALVDLDSPNL